MCNCSSNSLVPRRSSAPSPRTLFAVYDGETPVTAPFRSQDAAITKRNKMCSSEVDPCQLTVEIYEAP